jgi:integrase
MTRTARPPYAMKLNELPASSRHLGQVSSAWIALGYNVDRSNVIETVSDLSAFYRASRSYHRLSVSTKKSYNLYLHRIVEKFGTLPIGLLEERGARSVIRKWRDEALASQPRTADATIAVFRMLLNFAVSEEYMDRNPLLTIGPLHTKSRRDVIWSDAQIALFRANAPRHLVRALLVAVWTGQRQGDLLALTWDAYDGKYIRLQQRKVARGSSGRRVKVLVSSELQRVLAEIKSEQITRSNHPDPDKRIPQSQFVLTNAKGEPWRGGFKCAWRKAVYEAGISGVTFHDLRGTFITLSHRAGATIRDIAEASGHDEKDCERVIRQHYLATGAEEVISKLEAAKTFVGDSWLSKGQLGGEQYSSEGRFTGPRRRRMTTKAGRSPDQESGSDNFER